MIKVNFIMGYLGSGKTTFIQSFLNSSIGKEEKILLIVNDFGKVNYDALSLGENVPEIKAITYGCLCCDLKIRFREILVECGTRDDLDRILIEPSGILIPDVITDLFEDPSVSNNLILEPLIQLIDVNLYFKIKKRWPPFIERQIAMSEKIVLNLIDGLSEMELQEVKNALVNINPNAAYFNFIKDKNADKIIFTSVENTENKPDQIEFELLGSHEYNAVQVVEELNFESQDELHNYFLLQGPQLVRAKGIVAVNNSPFFVNYTLSQFSLLPCSKSFEYGISMIFSKE